MRPILILMLPSYYKNTWFIFQDIPKEIPLESVCINPW